MAPRLLCIDEDPSFGALLSDAFRNEGYEVNLAATREAARSGWRAQPPTLVVMDAALAGGDELPLLAKLRRDSGEAAQASVILLVNGSGGPALRQRAARLGAVAVLARPVSLERLITIADKETGRCARVVPRVERKQTRERSALSGSFTRTPFPALLHHLRGMRANGVLHLESGKKRKKLQLRDGRPVAVKSNLVNECLGNLLAATGKISWDAMHESLRRAKSGHGPQGQILVAMHMLDEEDLGNALRRQAEEKFSEIFAWEQGRFRFENGVRLRAGANALSLRRSAADLVIEAVRTRLPLRIVDAALEGAARRAIAPAASPFYRFQEVGLSSAEDALLRGIDGSRRVGDLLPLDEPLRRVLYGALAVGLFELRAAPADAPASARPRVAATETRRSVPREDAETVRAELTALAERTRGRDAFAVLGVKPESDDDEVRRAYVELARRAHPDRVRHAGSAAVRLAEEVFAAVNGAQQLIATRETRMAYWRSLRDREQNQALVDEGQRALRAELEFQKGEGRLRSGRNLDGAIRAFERAVRLYPEEGEYHAWLGWAWYLAAPDEPGRLQEALDHLRQARKLAPDRETVYLFIGRLQKAAGRARAAEKAFAQAVQLDPDCVEAIRELRLLDMRRARTNQRRISRLVKRLLGR